MKDAKFGLGKITTIKRDILNAFKGSTPTTSLVHIKGLTLMTFGTNYFVSILFRLLNIPYALLRKIANRKSPL